MKKNVIIGILTIVSLASITYGYVQKERADKQEALAIENGKIAREAEINSAKMIKEAELQKIMAFEQAASAMIALEGANNKK